MKSSVAVTMSLVFLLGACDDGESPAPEEAAPVANQGAIDQTADVCLAGFARARQCTEVYIPALVDQRVRLDAPPGIAAQAAELGREELIAEAKSEWAQDSRDENIAATCGQMSEALPAEDLARLRATTSACLAETSCDGYVACMAPTMEQAMTRRPPD